MKKASIILNELAKYIKPAISFPIYELNYQRLKIYFLKKMYTVTINGKYQLKYKVKIKNISEDEVLEFLKKEGVYNLLKWLRGGFLDIIVEEDMTDELYRYVDEDKAYGLIKFNENYLDKLFKRKMYIEIPLLIKGEQEREINGYSYEVKEKYIIIRILHSDKLTCVYSPDVNISICDGIYSVDLEENPKWIDILVIVIPEEVYNSSEFVEEILKDVELQKIYNKYIRPYLPTLALEIAEKLKDDSIPKYIFDLGIADLGVISEFSKKINTIVQHFEYKKLPNYTKFSKIYEYSDYFIIPLYRYYESYIINGRKSYYYYIAKRGKVIFVFWTNVVGAPKINLAEKLIHIPSNSVLSIKETNINIDEIIANKDDLDIFL